MSDGSVCGLDRFIPAGAMPVVLVGAERVPLEGGLRRVRSRHALMIAREDSYVQYRCPTSVMGYGYESPAFVRRAVARRCRGR